MAPVRQAMLQGESIPSCDVCRVMEQHGKVSGRQKQLLKTGVHLDQFEKTMSSSPWIDAWRHSQAHQGSTDLMVQDWQIDLGNFCNSACLFCHPGNSSRLASEHFRLGLISEMPPKAWCDDAKSLDTFISTLRDSPHVQYLHFIGGETMITPAFRIILQALIDTGMNKRVTLGFTTNLTVIHQDILDLLYQFDRINLGVSVECLDPINDYVRYGGTLDRTRSLLDRWVEISKERQWLMQIRTTPTVLTISRLHTIWDYAWNSGTAIESCNFIERPEFMRPSVLPLSFRRQARQKLQSWIDNLGITIESQQVVNIRNPDFVHQQILQDARSYVRYLDDAPDESHLLPDLVNYLRTMDQHRGNSILDYLPEYEELFRTAGY